MATHFKGPVISENGFVGAITGGVSGPVAATTLSASTSLAVGASPASIKKIGSGTISVNPGTLAAGAELDVTGTITGLAAGDIIQVNPPHAAMETGLAILSCWVSAADTVSIRLHNANAVAALVGGAQSWTYLWHDIT